MCLFSLVIFVLIVIGCVIIIPIIIVVVLAIVGFKYVKDNDIDIKEYIEESATMKGTIGDTLSGDDVKITLTDVLIYPRIEGEAFTDTPAEGKEYLVFFFNVENIDEVTQEVLNSSDTLSELMTYFK